jgi:uroporphyrinogen decarboxylase
MNNKNRVLNAIHHKGVDRIPLMYRALPAINNKLLAYFSLDRDIEKSWQELMKIMGFDLFSGGNGIGKFTKFKPSYTGPIKKNPIDHNFFYIWGINSHFDEKSDSICYQVNQDFARLETIDEMEKYCYPDVNDFDYRWKDMPLSLNDNNFLGTGTLNSIFMIALYLRGFDNLMIELLSNKSLAKFYINKIGEFVFEYTKKIFENVGGNLEFLALWDDLAMQNSLMIPHYIFREFFLPWYKKIFGLAKKYDLITYFHVCGNANEIIPDLIDIGVDILDPIQTSAKDMQIDKLHKRFGNDICFHGGIDVQALIPFGKLKDIRNYINWVLDLFDKKGGLILGPSHDITVDSPLENILAIYRPDLVDL